MVKFGTDKNEIDMRAIRRLAWTLSRLGIITRSDAMKFGIIWHK